MASNRRKDSKGRVLMENEFQKKDGKYEFRYYGRDGMIHSVYSWRLKGSDPIPVGKRKCKSLRELESEIERSLNDRVDTYQAERITLNDLFDKYIKSKPELRDSTRNNYVYMYNRYVRDTIGLQTLSTFRYTMIVEFYKSLIFEMNISAETVEIIHTVLHPIFTNAVRDELIRANPSDGAMKDIKEIMKRNSKPKKEALTKQQQNAFMKYISENQKFSGWENIFTVLLWTGLRIGEFIGLTWDDCSCERNEISVNHSLLYRQAEDGKCGYTIHDTKTEKGDRVIPMLEPVKTALLKEKERQERVGVADTVIDGYSKWAFTNRYKTVFNPSSVNKAIKRIVTCYNQEEFERAKQEKREPVLLPYFSAHICRHTFCTRLCEVEHRVKIIQEIMGHADISTTMDIYNSVSNELKKESFEVIEEKLFLFDS